MYLPKMHRADNYSQANGQSPWADTYSRTMTIGSGRRGKEGKTKEEKGRKEGKARF